MKWLLSISVLIISLGSLAQENPRKELKVAMKAQKAFDNYQYAKVIDLYEDLVNGSLKSQRNLAISYWKLGSLAHAQRAYSRIMDMPDKTPQDILDYAMLLRQIGEYEESIRWMKDYSELNKEDAFVNPYLEDPNAHETLADSSAFYDLVELAFNSSYQDLAATYFDDGSIVFVSNREPFKPIVRRTNGSPFLNMYQANTYDSTFNLIYIREFGKKLNSSKHDGPVCFSKDNSEIYFTANSKKKNKDGVYPLQLYYAKRQGSGWSKPQLLSVNDSIASSCHPSLSSDGNSLYFASNRAGSLGGYDIYRADKKGEEWGAPFNMGSRVNTKRDEVFPFVHESGQILTFASNGRVGLGGLDVFICPVNLDKTVGRVFNLGAPINSNGNDFAFIIDKDQKRGYLTSDRDDGKGREDIYGVDIKRPIVFLKVIMGTILDEDGRPAGAVEVRIKDETGKILNSVSTDIDGKFRFEVEEKKNYQVEAENWVYKKEVREVNTKSTEGEVKLQIRMKKE